MEHNIITNVKWTGEHACSASFGTAAGIKVTSKSGLEAMKSAWSPVHMLVSAAEACFLVTFLMIAEKSHVAISSYESEAEGEMGLIDGKRMAITSITIRPKIKLVNPVDETKIPNLLQKAEEYCVVANSLKLKINISR